MNGNTERKKSSINAVFSVSLAMLLSNSISALYYHPRPFVEGLGTQLIEHAPDSSFPSDHTTFVFSIAIMLLLNKTTRTIGYVFAALSFISGIARGYGGVHYPLDILGGVLVATISSVVVFMWRNKAS